eukprot:TRINITY_DN47954_c0_g1_i1.p1 TRINITY_DN47954_c0_g1~~TRINITY_DN47954_c0_g1_i1.p1  ORF type:complete len:365 (-),score=78.63 TRINITY_DN47954_c0_g1_i1:92-1186(-)
MDAGLAATAIGLHRASSQPCLRLSTTCPGSFGRLQGIELAPLTRSKSACRLDVRARARRRTGGSLHAIAMAQTPWTPPRRSLQLPSEADSGPAVLDASRRGAAEVEAASRQLWHFLVDSEEQIKEVLRGLGGRGRVSCLERDALFQAPALGPLRAMLQTGASIDWKNEDCQGATLLVHAARQEKVELATCALAFGADAKAADAGGRSALHWAAFNGCLPLLQRLLTEARASVPVGMQDACGDTPLHLAAAQGNAAAVRLLCLAGSCMSTVSRHGLTALETAEVGRKWEAAAFLRATKDKMMLGVAPPPQLPCPQQPPPNEAESRRSTMIDIQESIKKLQARHGACKPRGQKLEAFRRAVGRALP